MTIIPYLMGGLGNYMFQIAAAYSLALDLGVDFGVNRSLIYRVHGPFDGYGSNIFSKVPITTEDPTQTIAEQKFSYSPLANGIDRSVKLYGYFQTEKYFKHHEREIRELFSMDEKIKEKLLAKYPGINDNNTVSIHVRRGDYLKLPTLHPVQSMDYFKSAFSVFGGDKTYYVFSDDLEWCKKNFNFFGSAVFCEGNKDHEDLYLMSMCKDNIIANSSFSWWGAWLNENPYKMVVAPSIWFGPGKNEDMSDIIPENWIAL